jgi:hypothetical protein
MLRFIVGITGFMLVPFLIPFVAIEAAYKYIKIHIMEDKDE